MLGLHRLLENFRDRTRWLGIKNIEYHMQTNITLITSIKATNFIFRSENVYNMEFLNTTIAHKNLGGLILCIHC
jgi:hypothetical protein